MTSAQHLSPTGCCLQNAKSGKLRCHGGSGPVTDDLVEFSATQRDAGDGAPGATAVFPYDRMTVERFREAFPRARWRDDLSAWFVPGTRAEQRLTWLSREWSGVPAHADQRGRDAFM